MMRAFLFLLFLSTCLGSWSQIHRGIKELDPYFEEVDQLNEQLRSDPRKFTEGYLKLHQLATVKQDSSLLSFLYILQGSYHFYLNRRDSAIYYFDWASEMANKIGNSRIGITARIRRVFCDEYEKSALDLSSRMQENFKDAYIHNDTVNMIYSLNGLGLFFERMDSTNLALKCHYNALYLSQKGNYPFEEAFVLNNLGLMKLEMRLLDSALTDFKRGLEISTRLGNERLACHLRENIGYYYLEVDSFQAARDEFIYVLNLGVERGFKDLELSSVTNLAGLEQRQGNFYRCDSLYQKSLELAKSERLFHAVSPVYLGQVQLYITLNKNNEALALLDSSLMYAEFSSPSEIKLAYLSLKSSVLESMGLADSALTVHREFKRYSDSLNQVNNMASMAEIALRFSNEKKEKEQLRDRNKLLLQISQNEADLVVFRERMFMIIGLFCLVIAVVLIYYYRLKQRDEKRFSETIVNKLEEERGRIARDLHDGIGQSLIILKNKLNHTALSETNDKAIIDGSFSAIIEEVRSISRSLIPPELNRLGLRKAIEYSLSEVSNSSALFVTTEIGDLDDIQLEQQQSLRLYRIVQELTTNTIKHAQATAIKLEAYKKENLLMLIYQDNGIGLDKDKWKSADESVGLRSILQRLSYLNGSIRFERPKKGFKVIMKIQLT